MLEYQKSATAPRIRLAGDPSPFDTLCMVVSRLFFFQKPWRAIDRSSAEGGWAARRFLVPQHEAGSPTVLCATHTFAKLSIP